MFNFFHSFAVGLVSVVTAFTGAFHHSPPVQSANTEASTTSVAVSSASSVWPTCNSDYSNSPCVNPPKGFPYPKPASSNTVKSDVTSPAITTSDNIVCGGVTWSIKSICNDGYEPRCTTGTSVACYPKGAPVNQVTQNVTQQPQVAVPTSPQNTTRCNDTTYSVTCPTGLHFFCPTNGQAGMCVAADAQYCNGTAWNACHAGENFSCSSTGGVCTPSQLSTNIEQQQTQSQTASNQTQQDADTAAARVAKLAPLLGQFTQIIGDINTDCNGAAAGRPVAQCELTESKLLSILQQEVAIGITVHEAAPELSALQDAYDRLQTEYYQIAQKAVPLEFIQGQQANVAAEMQILANDLAMFAGR